MCKHACTCTCPHVHTSRPTSSCIIHKTCAGSFRIRAPLAAQIATAATPGPRHPTPGPRSRQISPRSRQIRSTSREECQGRSTPRIPEMGRDGPRWAEMGQGRSTPRIPTSLWCSTRNGPRYTPSMGRSWSCGRDLGVIGRDVLDMGRDRPRSAANRCTPSMLGSWGGAATGAGSCSHEYILV